MINTLFYGSYMIKIVLHMLFSVQFTILNGSVFPSWSLRHTTLLVLDVFLF